MCQHSLLKRRSVLHLDSESLLMKSLHASMYSIPGSSPGKDAQ
jgi:hypothetical protein